jgi:hypothetical protein
VLVVKVRSRAEWLADAAAPDGGPTPHGFRDRVSATGNAIISVSRWIFIRRDCPNWTLCASNRRALGGLAAEHKRTAPIAVRRRSRGDATPAPAVSRKHNG